MYKLDKDTEIAKVEVVGIGYHSQAKAYGEFYYPIEFHEVIEETIGELTVYSYDLDGKHSEVLLDAVLRKGTLGDFIEEGLEENVVNDESDSIREQLDVSDDVTYKFYNELDNLNKQIKELIKNRVIEPEKVVLDNNTTINGKEYSKGTVLMIEEKQPLEEGKILAEIKKEW